MIEHPIYFAGFNFVASNLGTLYSSEFGTLFLSDLHFGKTQHFRKHGIALTLDSLNRNFENLDRLLRHYKPKECIFLGDLFHSDVNTEWQLLMQLLSKWEDIVTFQLVIGNHDLKTISTEMPNAMKCYDELLWQNKLLLSHEPTDASQFPVICGHLHAGYTINGKGKQRITVKCFYDYKNMLVMPAFGNLTGKMALNKRLPGGKAYCYTADSFFEISNELV